MRVVLSALPMILATACSTSAGSEGGGPSGVDGTRNFAATGFDSVSLEGPDKVIVRVGGQPSVIAAGDTGVLDRLKIEVVEGKLKIGRIKDGAIKMSWGKDRGGATVTVTLPAIKAAAVAGSGDMEIDSVNSPDFSGSIAGSGALDIAAVKAGTVSLSIAGSGDARVAGRATKVKISIAGSGGVDAGALSATDARISIAGSGDVKANAAGSADISIVGSGDVDLAGGAKCSVSKMGSGDVRCASGTPSGTGE